MKWQSIKSIAKQTEIHKPNTSIENHLEFWKKTTSEHSPHFGIELNKLEDIAKIPSEIISTIITMAKNEDYSKNRYIRKRC